MKNVNWLNDDKKEMLKSLKGAGSIEVDFNEIRNELKYGSVSLNTNKNLEYYLHPIELKLRDRYLEIVEKHGNGLWAFDTLSWEVYIDNIDAYEALNEEEKYILNMYMKALRGLYK